MTDNERTNTRRRKNEWQSITIVRISDTLDHFSL